MYNSMTVFNYAEFHLKVRTDVLPTDDDAVVTDAFFEKATLVLLNVPDWCCISAYVLLIVVCAEALLQVTLSRLSSPMDWFLSFSFSFWTDIIPASSHFIISQWLAVCEVTSLYACKWSSWLPLQISQRHALTLCSLSSVTQTLAECIRIQKNVDIGVFDIQRPSLHRPTVALFLALYAIR